MQRFRFVLFASLSLMILTGVLTPKNYALADTNITANISANTTWTTAGGTYIIQNTISINSGVTLTVDPGVVVKFKATSTALYVYGILKAEGTATSSIYFTSYKDDTVGGNTDGVTAPVQAGNWDTISTASNATTTLKYATVRYGGGGYTAYTLYNNGGKLDVQNSVIATSTRYGISHSSGNTIIASTTINSNGYYGIYSNYASGNISVTNSTFYDNALAAGTFYFGSGLTLTNSGNINSEIGAGKRGFIMSGSTSANTTWTADGLPYILSGGFSINFGNTLTVNPGTVVKFENSSAYIQIGGTLNAVGDSTHQIYFTSIKDDLAGGDTNGDSTATTPSAGDWRHITVSSATANFSYATIRYGGGDAYDHANLSNNSGTYNISSSTISNASYYGIYHGGGTTNLTQSSLFGNGVRAYHNAGYATTTATNNFWGDSSGPYNAKYNPSGTGNAVSDYVSFIPWLYGTSSAPVLQGHITTDTNLTLPVYAVRGELTVDMGKKLTVKPGVVVKFEDEASLTVNGILVATSTASEEKIYFTSVKDDTVGGDTNGDSSATTPSAGDWGGVTTNNNATTTIGWVNVQYGGYSTGANLNNNGYLKIYNTTISTSTTYGIYQSSGQLVVQNSDVYGANYGISVGGGTGDWPVNIAGSDIHGNITAGIYTSVNSYIDFNDIHNNGTGIDIEGNSTQVRSSRIFSNSYGVWVESGNALITSNSISGNTVYGVNNNNGGGSSVIAKNNYWGDSDGPTGEGPGDDGDAVSTEVSFTPWLPEAHYLWTDTGGDVIFSVKNKRIYWKDNESLSKWEDSITTWDNLAHITFAEATTSDIDLITASEDRSDISYVATWDHNATPDTITVNRFYFDGYTDILKQNTLTHEIGHSLGLGHSYLENIMYYMVYGATTLGDQDLWDYHYLWDN